MASFTKPGLSHHTTLGGTGISIDRTDQGSLLIGDGEGFKLNTLIGGTGITIVNGDGTITISETAPYVLPVATTTVLGGVNTDRDGPPVNPIAITKWGLHRLVNSSLSTDSVMFLGDDDTDYGNISYINIAASTISSPHFGAAIKYTATGQDVFLVGNAGRVHITPVPGAALGFEPALTVTDNTYLPTVSLRNNFNGIGTGGGTTLQVINQNVNISAVEIQAQQGPALTAISFSGGNNVVLIQQGSINRDWWVGPDSAAVLQVDRLGVGPFTGPMLLVTDEGARADYGSSSTGPLLDLQSWQSTDSGLVDRFSINQLGSITKYHASTPSNGQLLIGDGSKFVPATLTAGSNITITNGAGTITIASTGGGSDIDNKALIQHPNASTNVKDDEFNDTAGMSGPINGLDVKWTKHNLGTPAWLVFDDTKAPGCLMFNIADGQPNDQAIYQTTPAGDFTIMAIIEPVTLLHREMWYVFILDTSGDGVGFGYDNNDGYSVRQMSSWQQTGIKSVAYGVNGLDYPQQVWLKKVGDTYTGAVGFVDRYRLMPATHSANLSFSFTAAYIGFGRIYNESNGTSNIILLDAFRVT